MKPTRIATTIVAGLIASIGLVGCAHGQRGRYDSEWSALDAAEPPDLNENEEGFAEPVAFDESAPLQRAALVQAVLERNPDLEAARQVWRAALAEHPQARSLEDTMASYSLAPLSVRSDAVRFGQVVRIEQRFPTPGKFRFAGEVALEQAESMREDYETVRLALALMASTLFDEYYRVTRLLVLNDEHRQLIEDIKASAMVQYEAGRVSQQDVLQAEVELAHIIHQRVMLASERKVIMARINGLLHQRPEVELPPPPSRMAPPAVEIPSTEQLQRAAIEGRPEVAAARSQLRATGSAVELAKRNYAPAIGIMGEYNSMWAETEHQWMAGVSMNLPLQIRSRKGSIEEAEALARRAEAELSSKQDEVRVQVDQARQRVLEAQHVVGLYQTRLLPAARAQIDAAEFGYETGRTDFQALIDAERSVRTLEIQYEEAVAGLGQRIAELERARGALPSVSMEGRSDDSP